MMGEARDSKCKTYINSLCFYGDCGEVEGEDVVVKVIVGIGSTRGNRG